jgi:hypothetical protein
MLYEFLTLLSSRRWLASGLLGRMGWGEFSDVSEALAACIIIDQTTRRNNPEDCHRHTRRRENLMCTFKSLER